MFSKFILVHTFTQNKVVYFCFYFSIYLFQRLWNFAELWLSLLESFFSEFPQKYHIKRV